MHKITFRKIGQSIQWIASGEGNWASGCRSRKERFHKYLFALFDFWAMWKNYLLTPTLDLPGVGSPTSTCNRGAHCENNLCAVQCAPHHQKEVAPALPFHSRPKCPGPVPGERPLDVLAGQSSCKNTIMADYKRFLTLYPGRGYLGWEAQGHQRGG